ncbi:MAG: hypothetical protein R2751_19465 [Bacteroidales bacterium]
MQRKQRNYKMLWIYSLLMIVLGIVFTINLRFIKPIGYSLLGVGFVIMVISLVKWKDRRVDDDGTIHID